MYVTDFFNQSFNVFRNNFNGVESWNFKFDFSNFQT